MVPKVHAKDIFEIDAASWAAVMEVVRKLAGVIEEAMGANGINLAMNNRDTAGQVVDHAHVHIIPRHTGDGFKQWAQHSYKDGEIDTVREKIVSSL